jgi:hypothetical protein
VVVVRGPAPVFSPRGAAPGTPAGSSRTAGLPPQAVKSSVKLGCMHNANRQLIIMLGTVYAKFKYEKKIMELKTRK